MARITPKTNWQGKDIPTSADFNRIEGNNSQAYDEIDSILNDPTECDGLKTFNDGIKTDTIDDISGNGINIDGVIFKDGAITALIWGA